MYRDDDPWADVEAQESERFDADIQMAEMAAVGNAIARARKAGRCAHQGAVSYRAEPCYPEQEGLRPGQSRCTDGCKAVFGSDDDWYAAMDAALDGV
jgi:hypothetical protein